jgi:hypothetical protein
VFQGTIFPDASITGQPGNSHSPQFGLHSGASEFMVQRGGYVVEGETQCVQEYVVKVTEKHIKHMLSVLLCFIHSFFAVPLGIGGHDSPQLSIFGA